MKKLLSLLLGACTIFTACTNEDDGIFLPDNQLQLKFGVNNPNSRAIFTESTLPNAKPVGVKLDDDDETAYDKYTNITFTGSDDGKGQQVWTPSEAVVLGPTKATLYAYYPWTSGVSIDAIPVDMTAEDQTDWLYATPVGNVNEDNASHAVTMNHALANINLTINRGSYVGDGNISSITVQSDAFATKGTFNAAQPEPAFTSFADTEGQPLTRSITATLGSTTDIMVVPTATEANIDFVINVDGVNYTAQAKPVQLVNGNSYLYTLTLNSTFLGVSAFSVQPWVTQQKEDDLVLEKEEEDAYPDYLKLTYDVKDISDYTTIFDSYEVKEEDVEKVLLFDETESTFTEIDVFHIDEWEENFTGYQFTKTGPHKLYIKFTDTAKVPENAFYYNEDLMEIEIPANITSIGASAFAGCPKIENVKVAKRNKVLDSRNNCNAIMETATNRLLVGCGNTVIPDECQIIGPGAFEGCRKLDEIVLPSAVRIIEESAFDDAGRNQGLPFQRIDLGNVEIIGERAFAGIYYEGVFPLPMTVREIGKYAFWSAAIDGISFNEGLQSIGKSAFNCTGLTEVVIPNSVTSIGESAFECCWSLKKITFGTGLQNMPWNCFAENEELKEIYFLSTTPPTFDTELSEVFETLLHSGTIYVPKGCLDAYSAWNTYIEEQNWTIQEMTE